MLTLEATICMLQNCQLDETIRSCIQRPEMYVELEVSVMGSHMLYHIQLRLHTYSQELRVIISTQAPFDTQPLKNLK